MLRLRVDKTAMEHYITSQKWIAQQVGIADNTMRHYWYGHNVKVDLVVLSRIAKVLGVSPLALLYDDGLDVDAEVEKLPAGDEQRLAA